LEDKERVPERNLLGGIAIRLVERDLAVLRELDRWRFCLSRHVRFLCGFSSQRVCDRRLHALIEAGFVDRRHVLYGVPSLYFVTHKGKTLIHVSLKPDKFKVEQIVHDIAVLDVAIYFLLRQSVTLSDITTEKELHQRDGFGTRQHKPDFVFMQGGQRFAVEVELTPKAKPRLVKNLQENFMSYDGQRWIIPAAQVKITQMVEQSAEIYQNIEILTLEEVTAFVKARQEAKS
jgi:DNA-binding HxlR family transcriptional regulator